MTGTSSVERLVVLIAVVTLIAPPFLPNFAHAAEFESEQERVTQNVSTDSPKEMETITVEAKRRELQRQISHFVSSVDVTYLNDSLQRWNSPICPLVAGLKRQGGEFILARLSQIARDSHAPLAPQNCRPNLYIVITDNPDLLVEKWLKHDRGVVNTCNGYGYVREFLRSRQPVRAFYNARLVSTDGANRKLAALDLAGVRLNFSLDSCVSAGVAGSRLVYGAIQSLSAVVIVADGVQIAHVNMGQLADYVAMVGLAQIRLDADPGTAPTILRLFRESGSPLQGLTPWDSSFLESIYTTDQSSVLQVSAIKTRMFQQLSER